MRNNKVTKFHIVHLHLTTLLQEFNLLCNLFCNAYLRSMSVKVLPVISLLKSTFYVEVRDCEYFLA